MISAWLSSAPAMEMALPAMVDLRNSLENKKDFSRGKVQEIIKNNVNKMKASAEAQQAQESQANTLVDACAVAATPF